MVLYTDLEDEASSTSSSRRVLYSYSKRRRRHGDDEDDSSDSDDGSGGDKNADGGSSESEDDAETEKEEKEHNQNQIIIITVLILVCLLVAGFVVYLNWSKISSLISGTPAAPSSSTSSASQPAPASSASSPSVQNASPSNPSPTVTTPAAAGNSSSSSPSSGNGTLSSGTSTSTSTCFPFGAVTFPSSGAPTASRSDWWCADSELYGFLGFSYPMEVDDCTDTSNSYDTLNTDFANMKSTFGATMVRIYAPECRQLSVWENIVHACVTNGMGVIVQVWWGFDSDQDLWKETESSIYDLFTNSTYAAVAPYVVHSASFGSEPIGDGVDGDNFITDLAAFHTKMNSFGIPVGISEDWDRPGTMSSSDDSGLGDTGTQVKANTDIVHAHIMPYYHQSDAPTVQDAWPYIAKWIQWIRTNVNQPIMLTECPWSSATSPDHSRGGTYDDQCTVPDYGIYWNAYANNCSYFKSMQAGWFIHTYNDNDEPYFGLLDGTNTAKIANFKPARC